MILCGMMVPEEKWNDRDAALLSLVPEDRRRKCMRYRLDVDKRLSLYSVLLLEMKLFQWKGISPEKIQFSFTPYGKPLLEAPNQIAFNLSHSGRFILCGMDEGKTLGVDTQKIETPPYEIMENCFHPAEQRAVENSQNPETCFYKIWTRKEAYFKCRGTGLTQELQNYNSLAPEQENYYTDWSYGAYQCAVYSERAQFPQMKETAFKELQNFFENAEYH